MPVALALPRAVLGGRQPKNGIDFTAWSSAGAPALYKGQKMPPGHCWTEPSIFCAGLSRPGVAQPMAEFNFVFPFKKYQKKKTISNSQAAWEKTPISSPHAL